MIRSWGATSRSRFCRILSPATLSGLLEPDWDALPDTLPSGVVAVLKRCLQKDPNQRLRDVADVRLQIEDTLAAPAASASPAARGLTLAGYAGWAVAVGATATAVALVLSTNGPPTELPETRLQVATPPARDPFSFALSPDGRSLVFEAQVNGRSELWLRPLESDDARPLAGTNGAFRPFWSPDSRSVGFVVDGVLKRIDLDGGIVRTLSGSIAHGGPWNRDGIILFEGSVGPMSGVSAEGGPVRAVTALLPGQINHRWAQYLPDGRRFLLFALGTPDVRGVYLGSLADTRVQRVADRESAYAFMPPSHILLASQGALWARRLNEGYTAAEGPLMPVAPKVLVALEITGQGAFSTSEAGSIAYRASAAQTQLVWLDRTGRRVASVGPPDDTQMELQHLSSDGRSAAVQRVVDGNTDVWLVDAERATFRRLTLDPGIDGEPIISPDGTRLVYVADGLDDVYQMYERPADGTGGETLLLESNEHKNPRDWSPDGRYILYRSLSPTMNTDLWALPLFGEKTPVPIARTTFNEWDGKFSPDGRWLAYNTNETGRDEVYIQPFPGPGPKTQISVGGGSAPRWRRDGRELFYLSPDSRVMAVPVVPGAAGPEAGTPSALFTLPPTSGYEPSPDGQRFLVTSVVSEASPITIILNWKPPDR
jgi:Tol biopolymer transport system component